MSAMYICLTFSICKEVLRILNGSRVCLIKPGRYKPRKKWSSKEN